MKNNQSEISDKCNENLEALYNENLNILKCIYIRDDKLKNLENSSYSLKEESANFYEQAHNANKRNKNSYNCKYFFIYLIIMILLFLLIKLFN